MKTMLGFIPNLDVGKYIRQLRGVVKWKRAKGRGTFEYATGVGKSVMALIIIKKLVSKIPNLRVIVVVPKISLKDQWIAHLTAIGVKGDVYVINTISNKDLKYECDLLILDEIHLYAADTFYTVFSKISYRWIVGLTATIKRLDNKHHLLTQRCPIIDVITKEQARQKGWISDYIIVNQQVSIPKAIRQDLIDWDTTIQKGYGFFGGDKDLLESCKQSPNARSYAQSMFQPEPWMDQVAIVKFYDDKTDMVKAIAYDTSSKVKLRQNLLYNSEHKIDEAVKLIQAFNARSILFGESTSVADDVCNRLIESGVNAGVYHSNVSGMDIMIDRNKSYKKKVAAEAFAKTVKGSIETTSDSYIVHYKVPKRISGSATCANYLKLFSSGVINTLCTAKSINAGLDIPDAEVGIQHSRNRNPGTFTQILGRVARTYIYKDGTSKRGVLVCLYIANSQDEKWLIESQSDTDASDIYWSTSTEETLNYVKDQVKR